MARAVVALLALGAVWAPGAAAQQTGDVQVQHDVMVAMRDGIRLATDVYLPPGDGPFPAVLVRTPYNKGGSQDEGTTFAQHGYAYVVQDVRGRFNSEGSFDIYVNEGPDGYDTAQWIDQQPWFDAQQGLALYGGSYLASTALSTALLDPPNLQAMYVYIASSNYHKDGAWRGGAYELAHNVAYATFMCGNQIDRTMHPDAADAETNMMQFDTPALQKLEETTPLDLPVLSMNCPWYRDWVMNEPQNWYWSQPGYDHEPYFADLPKIPIGFLGGWYDQFLGGTLTDYHAAKAITGQPVSLVIGPWIHGGNNNPVAGAGFFGKDAVESTTQDAIDWFDAYMGSGGATPSQPEVKYFVMGGGSGTMTTDDQGNDVFDIGGHWTTASAWPPPAADPTPYYLQADGALATSVPSSAAPDTYSYDPNDPVPTLGGNMSSAGVLDPPGAQLQTCTADHPMCNGATGPLAERPDVLSYQTPALDSDVTVAGHVSMDLYAASSAVDTDFTAKLVDVYPDGTAINVADGILRARYRQSDEHATPLTPGEPTEFQIDMWDTAIVFKAGHHIRIDISSSNFPHFDRNLNTGRPTGSDSSSDAVTASQTVFHDALRPSAVILPILPDATN